MSHWRLDKVKDAGKTYQLRGANGDVLAIITSIGELDAAPALMAHIGVLSLGLQTIAEWPISHPTENQDAVNMAIVARSALSS